MSEFNFKQEIKKIAINNREEQIIRLVEENFDEFIKKLKELIDYETMGNISKTKAKNKILNEIDKLARDELNGK